MGALHLIVAHSNSWSYSLMDESWGDFIFFFAAAAACRGGSRGACCSVTCALKYAAAVDLCCEPRRTTNDDNHAQMNAAVIEFWLDQIQKWTRDYNIIVARRPGPLWRAQSNPRLSNAVKKISYM